MQNIQLFCDSTGGFLQEELDALKVKLLSLSVHWDGKALVESTRDKFSAYYQTLKNLEKLPTTSQPSIGDMSRLFEEELRQENQVIAITLSHGLSGTYDNACAAAEMTGADHVAVIDSQSCTVSVKFMARQARRLIDEGRPYLEIVSLLREAGTRNGAIMVVDDVKYLNMGGRLQGAQYFVGKMLGIRPILKMKDGFLVPHKLARGLKEAFSKMIEVIPDSLQYLTVLHCDNAQGAAECAGRLKERFTDMLIEIEDLSPVIGTHLGNGSVGIVYSW